MVYISQFLVYFLQKDYSVITHTLIKIRMELGRIFPAKLAVFHIYRLNIFHRNYGNYRKNSFKRHEKGIIWFGWDWGDVSPAILGVFRIFRLNGLRRNFRNCRREFIKMVYQIFVR